MAPPVSVGAVPPTTTSEPSPPSTLSTPGPPTSTSPLSNPRRTWSATSLLRVGAWSGHQHGADVATGSADEAVVAAPAVHPVGARTALEPVVAVAAVHVVAAGARR